MGTYQDVVIVIIICCYKVSSQSLTLFDNTIVIDRNESISCSSDLECVEDSCNEGRVCIRVNETSWYQFGTITCDKDSSTPYCNGGLCSKIPRPGCDPTSFACPADGEFPDPTDCTRYHLCAQGVVTTNQCPRNTVYDHSTGGCKYRRYPSDCVTINCVGRDGRPFVYPRDDRIHGRCILGKPLILGRCENYERYDVNRVRCVRYCRTSGVQPPDPGPNSCRKYVLCVEVLPRTYEPVEMSCACNEGYDKEFNGCKVNATCLENVPQPWCEQVIQNDNSNESEDDDSSGNIDNGDQVLLPLIINNSGNNNSKNNISNGNDKVDGNLVNGNGNGNNSNSGNVRKRDSAGTLIINSSGNSNSENNITNGDDDVNGNIVNGNENGNNENTGNINPDMNPDSESDPPRLAASFIRIFIDWINQKTHIDYD